MSELDTTTSNANIPAPPPVGIGSNGHYHGSASYTGSEVVLRMTTTDPAVLALAQNQDSVDAFALVSQLLHLGAVSAQVSANELSTRVLVDAVKQAEHGLSASTAEAVTGLATSLQDISRTAAKELAKSLAETKDGIHSELAGEDSTLRISVTKAVDQVIGSVLTSLNHAQTQQEERMRRQLSLDDESSPLASLRRHVTEQHHALAAKVDELLQTQVAATSAQAVKDLTPVHGDEYEEAVITQFATIIGHDGFEDTHATPGRGSRAKVGDFVVTIEPGTRRAIRAAFEVKDEHQSGTKWRELLRLTLQNREAAVAIGIARTTGQFPGGGQRTWWIGEREAVVAWDLAVDDTETLSLLWSLIRVKALANTVAEHESLDLAVVGHHLSCAESHLAGLDSIESAASVTRKQMDTISQTTGKVKRAVQAALDAATKELSAAQ